MTVPDILKPLVRAIAEQLPRGKQVHCALCSMPAIARCKYCNIALCKKHGTELDNLGIVCPDCA